MNEAGEWNNVEKEKRTFKFNLVLCEQFARMGKCRLGAECPKSHGREGDIVPKNGIFLLILVFGECPNKLMNGNCSRKGCLYDHDFVTVLEESNSKKLTAWWQKELDRCAKTPIIEISSLFFVMKKPQKQQKLVLKEYKNLNIFHFVSCCFYEVEFNTLQFFKKFENDQQLNGYFGDLLRLNYVVNAGTSQVNLSFQRCLVPLAYFFSHSKIENSPLRPSTNQLYSILADNFTGFLLNYIACLKSLLDLKTVKDANYNENLEKFDYSMEYVPLIFAQVLAPLVKIFDVIFRRFSEKSRLKKIKGAVEEMNKILETCREMEPNYEHLYKTIYTVWDSAKLNMDDEDFSVRLTKKVANVRLEQSWSDTKVCPPVEIHDNDNSDFTKIRILPTSEEIMCKDPVTLPGNISLDLNAHWLPPGPKRMMDTHFRLLREDMVSNIKYSLSRLTEEIKSGQRIKSGRFKKNINHEMVDIMVYTEGRVISIKTEKKFGLCISLGFKRPEQVVSKETKVRFFEHFLGSSALVCLVFRLQNDEFEYKFATVVSKSEKISHEEKYFNVTVQPVDMDLDEYFNSGVKQFWIVENRKIMFEAFRPVLECLQQKSLSQIPFKEIICPSLEQAQNIQVAPPLFAKMENFEYNLDHLLDDGELKFSVNDNIDEKTELLCSKSTLDASQAKAILMALSKKVVCIQGPPGAGKTYIGVKIIETLFKQDLEGLYPILIITYTNHALDQFLENIADAGISGIVRIGSKMSEKMQKFKMERLGGGSSYIFRKEIERDIASVSDELHALKQKEGVFNIKNFLEFYFGEKLEKILNYCKRLGVETNEYEYWLNGEDLNSQKQLKGRNFNTFAALASDYVEPQNKREKLEMDEIVEISDPWCLSLEERRDLDAYWNILAKKTHDAEFKNLKNQLKNLISQQKDLEKTNNIASLQHKKIIGMTTTGAAKYVDILMALQPKVLICEEAAEILEAHILSSLQPSVQHLILIGDHKQLRPKVSEYNLSVESKKGQDYRLDVSMFERLVEQVPSMSTRLTQQRRMKPIISQFIKKLIYPDLQDGQNTLNREPIRGMAKDVYFWTHEFPQDDQDTSFASYSHSNSAEGKMVCQLVLYCLLQEYAPDQIVVLTPYLGQLRVIQQELKNIDFIAEIDERDQMEIIKHGTEYEVFEFENQEAKQDKKKIRVSTVDNYQGEESDIILVSLVRSTIGKSTLENIGFLGRENRINVLLSRARNGMYLVGNSKYLAEHNNQWKFIRKIMLEDDLLSDLFPIVCAVHKDDIRYIHAKDSISQKAPDGGCLKPCSMRLRCGHQCERHCHTDDSEHKYSKCKKKCELRHPGCDHKCEKLCHQSCGNCELIVDNVTLQCNHIYENPTCFESRNPKKLKCKTLVEKEGECGHLVEVQCGNKNEFKICKAPCGKPFPCGHSCKKYCGQCFESNDHGPCLTKCKELFPCGHLCDKICAAHDKGCPPCDKKCDITICSHGKCPGKCSEVCTPCVEKCTWSCIHQGNCPFPCGAPCVRLPCDLRCSKNLKCGHLCPSVCGEDCPDEKFCQVCASDEILNSQVDFISFTQYKDINLDENPIFVLSCGHVLTMETVDGIMELDQVYEKDQGFWVSVKSVISKEHTTCPLCRNIISPNIAKRYGRVARNSVLSQAKVNLLNEVRPIISKIEATINEAEANLCNAEFNLEKVVTNCTFEISKSISKLEKSPWLRIFSSMKNCLFGDKTSEESSLCESASSKWAVSVIEKTKIFNQPSSEIAKLLLLRSRIGKLKINTWLKNPNISFSTIKGQFFLCFQDIGASAKFFEDSNATYLMIEVAFYHADLVNTLANALISFRRSKRFKQKIEKEETEDVLHYIEMAKDHVKAHLDKNQFTERLEMAMKILQDCEKAVLISSRVDIDAFKQVLKIFGESSFGRVQWHECPNGHLYAIGECGRAMETSTCPDCGEAIGGQNHTLNRGNSRADELLNFINL